VKDDAGAVEEEPGDGGVDQDGDVDGFTEASFGAFIVEGVEEMDELVLVEFAEATGAHPDGRRSGLGGVGRRLERGHGLCGLTASGGESCAEHADATTGSPPRLHAPFYFLIFRGLFGSKRRVGGL
jgi:hypothetical protein